MQVLVFGQTGQVATELARKVPVDVSMSSLGRADADLSQPETCYAAIMDMRPDLVINAAAYTAVDKAEEERELAFLVNESAPAEMAKAAANQKIPLLHISTDYVFDGSGTLPWKPEDPKGPLGIYGQSKLNGEMAIQHSGCQHAIIRTSWVFSAHGANFVKTMLRLSETRDRLTIVADQIGGPTAAADIAETLWKMAEKWGQGNGKTGVFHFSGAPSVSWADFAREIFAQAGRSVDVVGIPSSEFPTPAQRPSNSRLDGSSLLAAYDIPQPDWRESLTDVLKELKELKQ